MTGVSVWAEEGKASPSQRGERLQRSQRLKSLDLVLYPVFVAVTVRTHSVVPVKARVSGGIRPGTIAGFIDDWYSCLPLELKQDRPSPENEESSWAEVGKSGQLMAEKTPKGVILKSFDLDTYPVLTAVAVRTHSVIPRKRKGISGIRPSTITGFFCYGKPVCGRSRNGIGNTCYGRILLGRRGEGRPSDAT